MTDIDNLDRLPTKFERILGAATSLFIFLFLSFVVSYSVFRLTSRHIHISAVFAVVLCVLTLLALWAAYMFVKITWGAAGKPSPKSQLIAGLITTIVGAVSLCSLVATAIKSGNELPQSVMPAVMLLVSGIVWSHRAWKQFRGKA